MDMCTQDQPIRGDDVEKGRFLRGRCGMQSVETLHRCRQLTLALLSFGPFRSLLWIKMPPFTQLNNRNLILVQQPHTNKKNHRQTADRAGNGAASPPAFDIMRLSEVLANRPGHQVEASRRNRSSNTSLVSPQQRTGYSLC